jgi:hypothetical protein
MSPLIETYIRAKHIDSVAKLQFLLFLDDHPTFRGNRQEFAQQTYFGSIPLLETIIDDLTKVGLIDYAEGDYLLHDDSDALKNLATLARAYDDPVARQEIIGYIREHTMPASD